MMKVIIIKLKAFSIVIMTLIVNKTAFMDQNGAICKWDNKIGHLEFI